jgi:hypothetical protein
MPRHTLDKWTYKLKTIDVCITTHKEDHIYNHMVKMYEKLEQLFEKYYAVYQNILKDLDTSERNMYYYKNYNWRQGDPSRFWLKNAEKWYLIDVEEKDKENTLIEFFAIYRIYSDFFICDSNMPEWNDEKPDWVDMVNQSAKYHNIMADVIETIKLYEDASFKENKMLWMEADKDWVEENNRKKDHKKHPVIQLPSTISFDDECEEYPSEPLRDDCIYCKKHWIDMKDKYEKAIEIRNSNKQERDSWLKAKDMEAEKQRERKTKQFKSFIEKQSNVDLCCYTCDYTANSEDQLDNHKKSEIHKDKLRYCKDCDLQCKSDYDYSRHINSNKHKKRSGLIDDTPVNYKCDKCDYESIIKCNYERHMLIKHNNN